MQFYIISSLIIYFLYRYSKIGYAIIGALMTACFTSLVVVYMKYDLRKNPEQLDKVITLTYIRPWSRINSYLVGMIVGYVLYEMPRKRWKISKLGALLGWCCAIATGLGTVYGLYRTPQGHSQTKPEAVFYQTVFRTLWASAVGWVAFACAIGKGGPVNSILSWSAFAPLAKLTYCTYLLHPILLEVYYRSSVTPFHYTDYNMVYIFLGNLVLSFAAAYIMSVCAETPFMALEKLILPTKGSSPPDKKQSSETSKLLQDSDHTLLKIRGQICTD
ncbi:nose resistant to fluoxetine protein 6-like [Amphiura filiformis]|uniref:nose resistant to fluoxetine protein 6-like n=1 Tax=Amphiura filiformis TaxID=82378 RepID=UPI003B21B34D